GLGARPRIVNWVVPPGSVTAIRKLTDYRISRGTSFAVSRPRRVAVDMTTRRYAATIHRSETVSQATSEVLSARGFVAPGTADGTMSLVLLTAACNSITRSRLPWARQYSHAAATDNAVTCNRYSGNDCPNVSL